MVDYVTHCQLQLGKHSQVHEAHNNTIWDRVLASTTLCSTGNSQGAYYFMSLTTSRCLNFKHFTPLPISQKYINGLHWLAHCNLKGFNIRDQIHRPFLVVADYDDDNNDDSTYIDTDEEGNEIDDSDNDLPPAHDATPADSGVTTTDLCNLRQNAVVHDDDAANYEEGAQNAENDDEESVTHS